MDTLAELDRPQTLHQAPVSYRIPVFPPAAIRPAPRRRRPFRRLGTVAVACCMGSWLVVAAIPAAVFVVSVLSH